MILSKQNTQKIDVPGVIIPGENLFALPEKVLQFGTGVLLRGLPDFFIDKANKQGIFNGRIVVIKSTSTGAIDAFNEQDGLYTICVRGVEGESTTEENIINASISRVLSANDEWDEILKCAGNPAMQVVISNTTEVGITLIEDNINAAPPVSFPGKLLAFLYRRYLAFDGSKQKGMVIIPTELIINNADKLKSILIELAKLNKLEDPFIDWVEHHNYFCNSLVDRIVPGKLSDEQQKKMEKELGYQDGLMIMSELYRLWAIENSEPKVTDVLSFSQADPGVIIAGNIDVFRELKLRLLNGSHTFSCGLAHLCGFDTVKEAMDNKFFAAYITELMMKEIAPAIVNSEISLEMAREFAKKVIDRYRNPHIDHKWLSIGVQYSSKMRMRNIPVIKRYYQQFETPPELMALGFAAFLLFLKAEKHDGNIFKGTANKKSYLINDDHISHISEKWSRFTKATFVTEVLADEKLWEVNLSEFPGFSDAVTAMLDSLETNGALTTLQKVISPQVLEQS